MTTIFIYCDDERHPGKRVAITNFERVNFGVFGGLSWNERPATRGPLDRSSTGYTLHGGTVDSPGWALETNEVPLPLGLEEDPMRVDFDLDCRKCRRPWTLSEGKLYKALDALLGVGVSEVSLVALAAIVQKQAES